jgi:hypothetical protein
MKNVTCLKNCFPSKLFKKDAWSISLIFKLPNSLDSTSGFLFRLKFITFYLLFSPLQNMLCLFKKSDKFCSAGTFYAVALRNFAWKVQLFCLQNKRVKKENVLKSSVHLLFLNEFIVKVFHSLFCVQ